MKFRNEYEFLSNMYPCRIVIDSVMYPSAEHAYQSLKCRDKDEAIAVSLSPSPSEAKKLGRYVAMKDDWDKLKISVMRKIVLEKFKQSPILASKLVQVEGSIVEDNNWGDCYWGVCNGIGENHLGKILEEVREYLK